MNVDQARQLVLKEATSEDGMLVSARMSVMPDRESTLQLAAALEAIFTAIQDEATLDRRLANALFSLSFHLQNEVGSWQRQGSKLREELLSDELPQIYLIIESIFEDEELF